MNIDIKDAITLNDENEYIVVSKVNFQNNTYYYLIDKNECGNVKFCLENNERNSLIDLDDANLIQTLLPLFLEASKNV